MSAIQYPILTLAHAGRTPLAGGLDALGGADATSGGHIHKRRAASAAVHAATAAVAAMDEDEGADAFGTPAAPQGLAMPGVYSTPFIPGLEQAAEQPQVCCASRREGETYVGKTHGR